MKILYLHGYGSSGKSSTARFLKKALPDDHITAPDIPVDPAEALPFLRKLCDDEHFDIIIGTSMGECTRRITLAYFCENQRRMREK